MGWLTTMNESFTEVELFTESEVRAKAARRRLVKKGRRAIETFHDFWILTSGRCDIGVC